MSTLVNQFVAAQVAKSTATGAVTPPAAGSVPTADGAGGAAWLPGGDPAVAPLAAAAAGVAPAGQRDLWAAGGGGASTGILRYSPALDILWASNGASGLDYSTNGGISFAPCIFDNPPPVGCTVGVKPDGSQVIALDFFGGTHVSADGVNFAQTGGIAFGSQTDTPVWYAAGGVWVVSNSAPGFGVATSPDGATWTPRPALNGLSTFAENGGVVVGVGTTAPFAAYSADGVAWTNTPSARDQSHSVTWSPERGEFLSLALATGEGFASADGIAWVSRGIIGQNIKNQLLWVGGAIGRWYMGATDPDNNYSLWSTPVSTAPFVGTHLDGAVAGLNAAGLEYDASRARFIIGTATPPYVFYSTARPLDLKMLGDNVRVRGGAAAVGRYSSYDPFLVSGTTAETVVSNSVAYIGALYFQNAQPEGSVLAFDLTAALGGAAGASTCTLRYKANGATMFTHALPIPALAVGLPVAIRSLVTVRNTQSLVGSTAFVDGTFPNVVVDDGLVYTGAQANTWSVTAELSDGAAGFELKQLIAAQLFPNGP